MAQNVEILVNFARRKLFEESGNLPAPPASNGSSTQQIIALPASQSSGSFPAISTAKKTQPPAPPSSKGFQSDSVFSSTNNHSPRDETLKWIYFLIIPITFVLAIITMCLLCMCHKRGVANIGPWKTGLSGQLQKAFVTGEL